MADLMPSKADNSPVSTELQEVFHIDESPQQRRNAVLAITREGRPDRHGAEHVGHSRRHRRLHDQRPHHVVLLVAEDVAVPT
jgi:hypothetical protein